MNRELLLLLLVCATFVTPPLPALSGPITVAPGVPAGDQYRLAFVTSTNTAATTSNIAYYNAFVNNAANLEPALSSLGTTWTAIASTAMVAARDNTNTNPTSVDVPIYNLAGQLIATSNADLWGGNLSASISYDEHGAPPLPGYTQVWTGTGSTGIPDDPTDPLGTHRQFGAIPRVPRPTGPTLATTWPQSTTRCTQCRASLRCCTAT